MKGPDCPACGAPPHPKVKNSDTMKYWCCDTAARYERTPDGRRRLVKATRGRECLRREEERKGREAQGTL